MNDIMNSPPGVRVASISEKSPLKAHFLVCKFDRLIGYRTGFFDYNTRIDWIRDFRAPGVIIREPVRDRRTAEYSSHELRQKKLSKHSRFFR